MAKKTKPSRTKRILAALAAVSLRVITVAAILTLGIAIGAAGNKKANHAAAVSGCAQGTARLFTNMTGAEAPEGQPEKFCEELLKN